MTTHQCHVVQWLYISTEGDRTPFAYCTEKDHVMAASTKKTVLFCSTTEGSKRVQWPVAVFNDDKSAKHYVSFLRMAIKTENVELLKSLDPSVKLTEAGNIHANMKYSVVELPYAPTPQLGDSEDVTTASF